MLKLREFTSDINFIDNIRTVVANLRDDISLQLNTSRTETKELGELNVDNNQYLSKLIQNSKSASGVIYGEIGTGKTYLFLLTNEDLGSKIGKDRVFSIIC